MSIRIQIVYILLNVLSAHINVFLMRNMLEMKCFILFILLCAEHVCLLSINVRPTVKNTDRGD